ncbi:hypothetical protein ACFRIB_41395 [Streptomyces mirabilis]
MTAHALDASTYWPGCTFAMLMSVAVPSASSVLLRFYALGRS